MKLTLVDIVKKMLVAVDAEGVTSVNDTTEAGMCVSIANTVYNELMATKRWPHLRKAFRFTAGTGLNSLVTPTNVFSVEPEEIRYNGRKLIYVGLKRFIELTDGRDLTDADVVLVGVHKILTGVDPSFITSPGDDETFITDSYEDTINGLDSSLSLSVGFELPANELVNDTEFFDMPAQLYPAFVRQCIADAVEVLKGDTQAAGTSTRRAQRLRNRTAISTRTARVAPTISDGIVGRTASGRTIGRVRGSC